MNANYQSQMPAIKGWLLNATKVLSTAGIPTPRLDAEIILAKAIDQDRTFLHAHSEDNINEAHLKIANDHLNKRLKRIPIAYILGYKEFYGRNFIVNNSTLIPRPESEKIIDVLKSIESTNQKLKLVDIGTGSGCLGITAKLELPDLEVTLIDISSEALKIAKSNAKQLSVDVTILKNDLLDNNDEKFDIIIANLPYVNPDWERSPETDFEPKIALFADDNGMLIIKKLIDQTVNSLNPKGFLILESDPEQQTSIINYAKKYSLKLIKQIDYITVFIK